MVTVVLCGSKEDWQTGQVLRRALNTYGGVQYCGPNTVVGGVKEPSFLLWDCTEVPKMEHMNGILVFKNSFCSQKGKIAEGVLPVLDSQNEAAAEILRKSGCIALTCGTPPRDTVSIASLRQDESVVSLQRSVITLSGEVEEPHDFPVHVKKEGGVYPLLAACSVLLLAGVPSAKGYTF